MEPRGVRNHNWLNIEHVAGNQWQGLDSPPSDSRFCRFVAPEYGLRAGRIILLRHQQRGSATIADHIAGRAVKQKDGSTRHVDAWAPPFENDTAAYIKNVQEWSRLGPGRLDLTQSAVMQLLLAAMIRMEVGLRGAAVQDAIIKAMKLPIPRELLARP